MTTNDDRIKYMRSLDYLHSAITRAINKSVSESHISDLRRFEIDCIEKRQEVSSMSSIEDYESDADQLSLFGKED